MITTLLGCPCRPRDVDPDDGADDGVGDDYMRQYASLFFRWTQVFVRLDDGGMLVQNFIRDDPEMVCSSPAQAGFRVDRYPDDNVTWPYNQVNDISLRGLLKDSATAGFYSTYNAGFSIPPGLSGSLTHSIIESTVTNHTRFGGAAVGVKGFGTKAPALGTGFEYFGTERDAVIQLRKDRGDFISASAGISLALAYPMPGGGKPNIFHVMEDGTRWTIRIAVKFDGYIPFV